MTQHRAATWPSMGTAPPSACQVGCRPTCGVLREDLAEGRVQRHIAVRRRYLAIPHDVQSRSMVMIAGAVDVLHRSGRGRDDRPLARLHDGRWHLRGFLSGQLPGWPGGHRLPGRDLHGQPDPEQVVDDLVAALSGCEPAAARNVRIEAEAPVPGLAPRGRQLTGAPEPPLPPHAAEFGHPGSGVGTAHDITVNGGATRDCEPPTEKTPRAWPRATPRGSESTLRRLAAAAVRQPPLKPHRA